MDRKREREEPEAIGEDLQELKKQRNACRADEPPQQPDLQQQHQVKTQLESMLQTYGNNNSISPFI